MIEPLEFIVIRQAPSVVSAQVPMILCQSVIAACAGTAQSATNAAAKNGNDLQNHLLEGLLFNNRGRAVGFMRSVTVFPPVFYSTI
jgi:hypothetical protein